MILLCVGASFNTPVVTSIVLRVTAGTALPFKTYNNVNYE